MSSSFRAYIVLFAVCMKVLEAPATWQWPQQISAPFQIFPGQALEQYFGPVHPAQAQLHWLRPSLQCVASVSQQGELQVWL